VGCSASGRRSGRRRRRRRRRRRYGLNFMFIQCDLFVVSKRLSSFTVRGSKAEFFYPHVIISKLFHYILQP
jgi:hypothetical protein